MDEIPFEKLPVDIKFKYAYCRFFYVGSLVDGPGDFNLVGVYDFFSDEIVKDVEDLIKHDFLFGEIISFDPPLRGKGSYKLLEKRPINITKEELPHFKIGPGASFYVKEGRYYVFAGVKTEPEKIEHLEENFFYSEYSIRLRMIIELIKRKAKELGREILRKEWEEITKAVWCVPYGKKIIDEEEKQAAVDDLLDSLLDHPDYRELPKEMRGRARNGITKL